MGKITFLIAGLLTLTACFENYDGGGPCAPSFIGADTYVFQQNGSDTIQVDEKIRFQITRLNPKIQRVVTTERLPYPPTAELVIYAISDTVPPFASDTSTNYTYTPSRPFRVITSPGLSSYAKDHEVAIKGEFVGDSIKFDFELRALSPGLYKIQWKYYLPVDYYLGPGLVSLDAKIYRCNYFWRMVAEFDTNQSFEPYNLAFPGIVLGEQRFNRLIYVLP